MRTISLKQAQDKYIHRYTLEHLPEWAKKPHYDETTKKFIGYYKPQYKSDNEWYDNTIFPGEGNLSTKSKYCESKNPSWPLGTGFSETPCMNGQI